MASLESSNEKASSVVDSSCILLSMEHGMVIASWVLWRLLSGLMGTFVQGGGRRLDLCHIEMTAEMLSTRWMCEGAGYHEPTGAAVEISPRIILDTV